MTKAEDFAWACGLFEGEGSICHYLYQRADSAKKGRARRLTMRQTDLDVLQRFETIVGGRISRGTIEYEGRKPIYTWSMSSWVEVEPLLRRMLPHLGLRRRAAAQALLADPPRRRTPAETLSGWKDGEVCASCASRERPYRSLGMCDPCYIRDYRRRRRGKVLRAVA